MFMVYASHKTAQPEKLNQMIVAIYTKIVTEKDTKAPQSQWLTEFRGRQDNQAIKDIIIGFLRDIMIYSGNFVG